MKSKLILSTICFSLIACSSDDGDSKNNEASAPPSASHPLIQKPELTKEQLAEVKAYMKNMDVMPDNHILLERKDSSPESRQEIQERIAKLSTTSKEVLSDLKARCEFKAPDAQISGETKAAGDKQLTLKMGQINGSNCPIFYNETESNEVLITESNYPQLETEFQASGNTDIFQKLVMKGTQSLQQETEMKILDPEMQKKVGFQQRMSKVSSTGSSTMIGQNNSQTSSTLGKYDIVASDGQKFLVEYKTNELTENDQKDSYDEMNFNFPNSNPVLQIYKSAKGEEKMYLNGQLKTAEEIAEIFGKIK